MGRWGGDRVAFAVVGFAWRRLIAVAESALAGLDHGGHQGRAGFECLAIGGFLLRREGKLVGVVRTSTETHLGQLLVQEHHGEASVFLVACLALLEQVVALVVQVDLGNPENQEAADGEGHQ